MCSIFGLISLSNKFSKNDLIKQCKIASDTMKYRGPDNSGFYNYKNAFFAHNRLSIIDLRSISNQPMLSESKNSVLVFNGEIYNFNELSTQFNKLKTLSDTEVLLKYLDEFGIDKTLENLEGMFAFSYYNFSKNILYLARDRSGMKPIYWMKDDNFFIFSSDLKSLKKIKNIKLEVDRDSVASFLRFNYIPAPYTIYNKIYKLKPGEYLKFNLNDYSIRREQYFKNIPSINYKKINFPDYYDEFKIQINTAVKKCLISDRDVGTFLSGGIDSTLITALAQKFSSQKINSFYIGFEQSEYDERKYAEFASEIIGTNHQDIILNKSFVTDIVEKLPEIYDEPFADSSQIPTYLLCKYAKRKNTVVLSGDGGDEVFGGYHRYDYVKKLYYLRKLIPDEIIKLFRKNINLLPSQVITKFNLVKRLETLQKAENIRDIYLNTISHTTSPEELVIESKEHILTDQDLLKDLPIFLYMKYHDFNYYLPNDILNKMDRASMYNSMELRIPFLEKNILDFLHQTNLKFQNRYYNKKRLLISLLKEMYPQLLEKNDFFTRNKLGLGCAIQDFMNTVLKDYFNQIVNKDSVEKYGILNYENVEKILKFKNKKGEFVNYFLVWNIFIFQQWCSKNL